MGSPPFSKERWESVKRTLALCLLLCLSLCGCKDGRARPSVPAPAASGEPAPVLAFFGDSGEPWSQAALEGTRAWCGREGWELVEYDCLGAASTLELQVDDLERGGGAATAVVCAVAGRESLEETALALSRQGAKVMTLSGTPLGPLGVPAGSLCHLEPDPTQAAGAAAALFRETLEPGTGVILLYDVGTLPLETAALPALAGAGVPVAEESYTWGSVEYTQTFVQDILARRSDVGGVACFSRTGALGARSALEEAGLADRVAILCLDGSEELQKDLERGTVAATMELSEDALAKELDDALTGVTRGERLGKRLLTVELRRPRD